MPLVAVNPVAQDLVKGQETLLWAENTSRLNAVLTFETNGNPVVRVRTGAGDWSVFRTSPRVYPGRFYSLTQLTGAAEEMQPRHYEDVIRIRWEEGHATIVRVFGAELESDP